MKENTEQIAKSIRAYDKKCIGCQRHEKELMIAIQKEDGSIHDFFFTNADAEHLYKELGKVIESNKEPIHDFARI